MNDEYPVKFSVDYPDRDLNRLTTFFRIFTAIPILIIAALLGGSLGGEWSDSSQSAGATFGGLVVLPTVLMLLFRKKYPRWWFDWNLQLMRFSNRIGIYLALMDDQYPSTDEEQSVHLEIDYPNTEELSRGLPLIKWFLAIPHYIVLFFLALAAAIVIFISWFAILFTGRYPRGMFEFVEGTFRWSNRVYGYMAVLSTDRYPPFDLK